MLPHQMVACRVEEDGKAPRVSKSDKVGFAWKELDVERGELNDLFASYCRLVDSLS